jgi:hypothetical protein
MPIVDPSICLRASLIVMENSLFLREFLVIFPFGREFARGEGIDYDCVRRQPSRLRRGGPVRAKRPEPRQTALNPLNERRARV